MTIHIVNCDKCHLSIVFSLYKQFSMLYVMNQNHKEKTVQWIFYNCIMTIKNQVFFLILLIVGCHSGSEKQQFYHKNNINSWQKSIFILWRTYHLVFHLIACTKLQKSTWVVYTLEYLSPRQCVDSNLWSYWNKKWLLL